MKKQQFLLNEYFFERKLAKLKGISYFRVMIKKTAFILILFYTLPLCAQAKDLPRAQTAYHLLPKQADLKKQSKSFLNFSDFDTLYISPNRYNYNGRAYHQLRVLFAKRFGA